MVGCVSGCVGTAGCHTLLHLCKSVLSVGDSSLQEGSVCSVRSVGDIPACFVDVVLALTGGKAELRLLYSGGSVGMAGCHTLLICVHPCQSVGGISLPEGSVRSVRSVGGVSQPEECVLWEVLLNQKSEFRGRLQFLDAEASDDAEDESMSVGVLLEVVHACLAPVAEVADAPRGVQRTEVEREHLSERRRGGDSRRHAVVVVVAT